MPCFLTTNVRLACENGYRQSFVQERRKGNTNRNSTTRRVCARLIPSATHDFLIPMNFAENINPEIRKYVKSKTPTFSNQEQTRLKNAAKVMTIEERLDALAKKEEMSKQQHEKTERARNYFRQIDEKRLRDTQVSTVKEEVEDTFSTIEKKEILDLAFIAKQDQEEEVKALNRFILHAKCQAVRDAQMQEKRDIERRQRDEQTRLDQMVIEENSKILARDDTFALQQKDRSEKYALEIREQLLQRENLRFMEAERAVEEARTQKLASEALRREEELKLHQARERRQKFRAELDRIVEMSSLFKKMLCEQERETDLRIAAYMREKRNQEKQLEREKQLSKKAFERKQQMLYQLAEKVMASKSQREELSYLREQEHAEREYRLREKEAALRRKRLEDDIRETRQRQSQEIKTRQALQIAREEKDFMLLVDNLKKEEERLRLQEELRGKQRECYRSEIKRQISDKAVSRRRLLEFERNEANIWRESERTRLKGVRTVIGAKLAAMRQSCLPEQYIKDIERQMDRIIKRNPQQKQKYSI